MALGTLRSPTRRRTGLDFEAGFPKGLLEILLVETHEPGDDLSVRVEQVVGGKAWTL